MRVGLLTSLVRRSFGPPTYPWGPDHARWLRLLSKHQAPRRCDV